MSDYDESSTYQESASLEATEAGTELDQQEAEENTAFARRGQVNYDNFIDVILAGRQRKFNVEVPPSLPCRLTRPRRALLSDEQFIVLKSEVDGSLYNKGNRPELEIVEVSAADRPEEREVLLFDAGRELFVYSYPTEFALLKMLSREKDKEDVKGRVSDQALLSRVELQGWRSHIDRSDFPCLDLPRLRLWRRFLRAYFFPIFRDRASMRSKEDWLVRMAEEAQRRRNEAGDYSDTDSSFSRLTSLLPNPALSIPAPIKEEEKVPKAPSRSPPSPKPKTPTARPLIRGISKRGK